MRELFEHQKEGVKFLKGKNPAGQYRFILADEMGLGKTSQAIVAAGETSVSGIMVVCPASLKINWMREIKTMYPEDEVRILSTTEPLEPGGVWFIINYDIVGKKMELISSMVDDGQIDTMILDEAHYIKGKSIRAKSIIGGKVKKKDDSVLKFEGIADKMLRVYLLTGTPIMNRPIELFNLLKAIEHPLSEDRGYYAKRYCDAFMQTIYTKYGPRSIWNEQGAKNLPELSGLLSGYLLRRTKKQVLNLPDKIVSIMDSELSTEWKKAYETAWDAYIDFLSNNPMPEKNIDNIILAKHLVEIQKLKQVCSQAKVARIVADIENAVEQDEKIIVFSQYTETIKQIAEAVRKAKIKTVTLTGADDMHERQKAVDLFQTDPATKVFVANIKAGGVGINLTAGSIVMFADMDWSPEIHRQAEDRAHRIGQEGTVNIYYYVCPDTIEDDIIDILNDKKNIMDQILEGEEVKVDSLQKAFLQKIKSKVTNSQARTL